MRLAVNKNCKCVLCQEAVKEIVSPIYSFDDREGQIRTGSVWPTREYAFAANAQLEMEREFFQGRIHHVSPAE